METQFTNRLDPEPRSRRLFHFHKPETLAEWLDPEQNPPPLLPLENGKPAPRSLLPSTLRLRLRQMPDIEPRGLWPAQLKAVRNLEASLYDGKPRALIQMATGSGKTFTAVSSIYRLIKFGGAKRVLFLVDRANLGRQTLKEFQQYVTPDDGRKFPELYNVQHLTSNKLDPVAKVCITTIQRLYSMLSGEELKEDDEELSAFTTLNDLSAQPLPVAYNPQHPRRVLRLPVDRRVPPLHLQPVAPGAGVLRRVPHRPHRDALQADARLLPPEPRHGVRPRGGRRPTA